MMTPPKPRVARPLSPWMDRRDVADYLRCSPNSVDKLAREGLLTKHRVRGLHGVLFARREVAGIVIGYEETDAAPASAPRVAALQETHEAGAAMPTDTVERGERNA